MTTTINTAAATTRTARGFTLTAKLVTVKQAVATTTRSARGFTATAVVKKQVVATTARSARGFTVAAMPLKSAVAAMTRARGFTVVAGGLPRVTRSAASVTNRARTLTGLSVTRKLALSAMTRPRSFTGAATTFTSISIVLALPTFSVTRSLTTVAPVVLSGRGQIVRWIFEDPSNAGEVWTVPMNPNKMTSPYVKHNTTGTATSPITGQASGIRIPDVAVEWQFSGSLNNEAHFNQLLYWNAKPNPIYITDHLGRKWFCYLTKFDPVPKGTSPTNTWRYTYTVSALVFGRVGGPLV